MRRPALDNMTVFCAIWLAGALVLSTTRICAHRTKYLLIQGSTPRDQIHLAGLEPYQDLKCDVWLLPFVSSVFRGRTIVYTHRPFSD